MSSSSLYFTSDMVGVVTGASSGIGAGTAVKLAQLGLGRMCITGRNTHALINTKHQCIKAATSAGNNMKEDDIVIVSGNITDTETCESIVNKTIESFGRIDILINNAGIALSGFQETVPISQFDQIMSVNVRSVVVLTQLCIPHLKKTKGSIVNVSSITGIRPFPLIGFYCMSKAALDMFTKCLALELAPDGVRVNSVNPGVVMTQIQERAGIPKEKHNEYIEKNKKMHPLGRIGEIDEVAEAIVFLASSKASFMTGNITPVDSGRNLVCPR